MSNLTSIKNLLVVKNNKLQILSSAYSLTSIPVSLIKHISKVTNVNGVVDTVIINLWPFDIFLKVP